ncbi:TetR/AcrR family transcriptional regulator [Amycolatopsis sp. PS_44_ISF1]|uniref:TetR/AcrR family transcriptional regulator n=1 Tax=Amycolatopsis sp. PS_44_ISF1 TaxID=2974917 RepID=UPI0028E00D99|nr:TetR/AcrR family transcriptional regulator [Amycolatopsis sp. PS_44_ISF1]MDT8912295.1 TetR/AcrR family transcriptional regulator [Amycolatopsis sp. PS_44_ISF1]
MTPDEDAAGPAKGPSFVRVARRHQLVESAIETIAELGFEKASTVVIAQRAGVSRGVLTYHFRDRDELIEQVVQTVYDIGLREVHPPVLAAQDPRAALLAFAGSSVDFYVAYPRHVAALREIFDAGRHTNAPTRPSTAGHAAEMTTFHETLRAGQSANQFRDFDVELMASFIRAALDVAAAHLRQGRPAEVVRTELLRTLDAATRKEDT